MKIGILGGTFNPIHLGHLILADEAKYKLALDKVLFIPVYLPPHKEEENLISAIHRLKMVRLAVKGNLFFEVSDTEIKRKGKSYSIDTLRFLKDHYPGADKFFFIVGSDSLSYLHEWKDREELMKLAKFVVASRPNYPLENLPKGVLPLVADTLDISAVTIRRKLKNNEPVQYLMPKDVYSYIIKEGLYK